MGHRPIRLLSSFVVRSFVAGGGSLRYHAVRDEDGAKVWEVFGVDREGNELPIMVGRTGLPKILRSATAVVNYHKSMLPDAREVLVPIHEDYDVEGDIGADMEEN